MPNAIRMSDDQVAEVLARLSPVAEVIAMVQAKTPEEKKRIENLPPDIGSSPVSEEEVASFLPGQFLTFRLDPCARAWKNSLWISAIAPTYPTRVIGKHF